MGLFGGPDVEVDKSKKDPKCDTKVTETNKVDKTTTTTTVCAKDGRVESVTVASATDGPGWTDKIMGTKYGTEAQGSTRDRDSHTYSNSDGTLTREVLTKLLAGHEATLDKMVKAGVVAHYDATRESGQLGFVSDIPKKATGKDTVVTQR